MLPGASSRNGKNRTLRLCRGWNPPVISGSPNIGRAKRNNSSKGRTSAALDNDAKSPRREIGKGRLPQGTVFIVLVPQSASIAVSKEGLQRNSSLSSRCPVRSWTEQTECGAALSKEKEATSRRPSPLHGECRPESCHSLPGHGIAFCPFQAGPQQYQQDTDCESGKSSEEDNQRPVWK